MSFGWIWLIRIFGITKQIGEPKSDYKLIWSTYKLWSGFLVFIVDDEWYEKDSSCNASFDTLEVALE